VTALTLGRPWLVPIAVAVLIWFLINALADALSHRAPALPRAACTGAALAVLTATVLAVIQVIARNAGALADGLSGVDERLVAAFNEALAAVGLGGRLDLEAILSGYDVEGVLTRVLSAARELIGGVALVFLYVMFLLLDQRFYEAKLRALAPDPARRAWLRATLKHIADETRAYLWLMTLISMGVGVATGLALWAFGVAGAAFWGFLAFGLNFIPTIGSILGVAIPCVYALLQFEDPSRLLALIPVLAAIQFAAGEVVLPRVMGDRLNLSGFVILLLLVVWGAMWGPAGMFLAIPITVIVMIVFSQFPRTRPIALALSRSGRLAEPLDPVESRR
ncbi:MAG: AI-2E family transporter, partial [Rubrimonas sp.]